MTDYSSMSIRELLRRYSATRDWRETSAASNKSHIATMLEYFGDFTIGELSKRHRLFELCKEYAASCGDAPATSRKRLSFLKAVLTWAWEEKQIDGVPLMWMPPPEKRRDRQITDEERQALLEAADRYPTPQHLRTYVYLMLETGQYRHAVTALTWDKVNLEEGTITFEPSGNSKGGVIQMDGRLQSVMEKAYDAMHPDCQYVIQYRAEPVKNLREALQSLYKRAGVEGILEHDLRRANNGRARPVNRLFRQALPLDRHTSSSAIPAEMPMSPHLSWLQNWSGRNTVLGCSARREGGIVSRSVESRHQGFKRANCLGDARGN